MAFSIKGLHGHNFSSTGREELIATRGTKTWAYRSGVWLSGATVTNNKESFMASYLDKVVHVNATDNNLEYNGTYWTANENMLGSPIGQFVTSQSARLFLWDVQINGTRYRSKVWYSDLPSLNTLTWGLEVGSDLAQTAGSAVITSVGSNFQSRNIKIGDSFYITSGTNEGEYRVQSIDSETQITLTEDMVNTDSSSSFWVGGNEFDVGTEDGDTANGITEASNEIILLKKGSVYRYNVEGKTLRRIKDVPGTTSIRSPISWGGYAWWYHPSGIYRTGGGTGEKVSNAVEDIIEGVPDQTAVVGFVDQRRNEVGWYLGTATLRDGDTISNCAVVLNLDSQTWEPRSYDKTITIAANWLKSSIPETYVGDNDSGIFQLNTGTSFNTADIPFGLELYPIFPAGEDAIVIFNRIRSYIENGPDIQLYYKLIYKPRYGTNDVWDSDDTWYAMQGSQIGDRVDWYFPTDSLASGVKLKVVESGGDESFLLEKLTLYWSEPGNF